MRRRARDLAAVTFGLLAITGCPPGPGVPEDDTCVSSSQPQLASVEIGAGERDALFEPFVEGGVAPIVYGPQGGAMFRLRLRTTDQGAPSCLPQETTVRGPNGELLTESATPIRLYRQSDGSSLTRTHWLIFHGWYPVEGTWAEIETRAGGHTVTEHLWLGEPWVAPTIGSLSPAELTLAPGADGELTISLTGASTSHAAIYFASEDPDVVTIDPIHPLHLGAGASAVQVSGQREGGPVTLTAILGRQEVTATITVTAPD
jgi:hypothetical protein